MARSTGVFFGLDPVPHSAVAKCRFLSHLAISARAAEGTNKGMTIARSSAPMPLWGSTLNRSSIHNRVMSVSTAKPAASTPALPLSKIKLAQYAFVPLCANLMPGCSQSTHNICASSPNGDLGACTTSRRDGRGRWFTGCQSALLRAGLTPPCRQPIAAGPSWWVSGTAAFRYCESAPQSFGPGNSRHTNRCSIERRSSSSSRESISAQPLIRRDNTTPPNATPIVVRDTCNVSIMPSPVRPRRQSLCRQHGWMESF
jgi:hypothetical protein